MLKIRNTKLANFLMLKLNKLDNKFKEEDFLKINKLVIDDINTKGEKENTDLNILVFFHNLEKLELINLYIPSDIIILISKLRKIEEVKFKNCTFENPNILLMLKVYSLSINNSPIDDTKFLESMKILKELSLINEENVYIKDINKLINLKKLVLSNSKIKDPKEELDVPKIKELYIDNTNLYDFSLLRIIKRKELEKLTISDDIYIKNKDLVKKLINKISVYNENMVKYID